MRLSFFCVLFVLFAGCAVSRDALKESQSRPAHDPSTLGAGEGSLVVLSAWDRFDTLDPEHRKHTSYQILSERGELVRRVVNFAGSFGTEPVTVGLPAGSYRVKALAANEGLVTAPVTIKQGRITILVLDGSTGEAGNDTKGEGAE